MSEASHAREIYLDYAATTPLDDAVAAEMQRIHASSALYGNPSSPHVAGQRSYAVIEAARASVAALLNAPPRSIVFTSGATEADNLAIKGAARFRAHRGRHIITVSTEHKAVLESASSLESEGFEVTRLNPAADGLLPAGDLAAAIRPDTQLVSIMHVNNETGVVQDLAALAELCRSRDILFHTDAAQSAGKLPLDVRELPLDLVSISAHKCHGPQGIGALYIADRPGCGVATGQHGGSQERHRRAGTEPVALIAGFGTAAKIAAGRMHDDLRHVGQLGDRLWMAIRDVEGLLRNGSARNRYPGILNVSAAGVEGESLMLALEPLCVATGSACNAQSGDASFVLKALGRSDLEVQSAIRFSFGRYTTEAEIDAAAGIYREAVSRLRALSVSGTAA